MENEKVLYNATACFLVKKKQILLGLKTKNIGKNCWNGYGGGIEEKDKSIKGAAIRELKEETEEVITLPEYLEKIAIVDFHNTKSDGKTFVCRVHFYLVRQWEGNAKETDEMIKPTWFDIDNIPYDQMMPADKHWLPVALSGKKIIVKAKLGPFQKKLLEDVEIKYVDCFHDD